jgi:hypothetical protein
LALVVVYYPEHKEVKVNVFNLSPQELEQALHLSSQLAQAEEWNLPLPPVPPHLSHLELLDWALVGRLHADLLLEKRLHPLQ